MLYTFTTVDNVSATVFMHKHVTILLDTRRPLVAKLNGLSLVELVSMFTKYM